MPKIEKKTKSSNVLKFSFTETLTVTNYRLTTVTAGTDQEPAGLTLAS